MEIKKLASENEKDYMNYVLKREDTLLYASLKYRNMLGELFDVESVYLIAIDKGSIVGVLPSFICRNKKYGNVINSLPFYGSNGALIAESQEVKDLLLQKYYEIIKEEECISATLITSPFEEDNEWYKEKMKCNYIDKRIGQVTHLPLQNQNEGEELINMFHKMVKRCIHKAEKNNISVKIDNSQKSVDFLYQIHKENMEKIGGTAKKLSFFETFPRHFEAGKDYNIYIAYKDGQEVAALLLFYFCKTVEYFVPVTVEAYRTIQPLSLIIFEAMKDAVKRGYRNWNWGGTWLEQDGVYDFKRKWGTTDYPYYYYTNIYDKTITNLRRHELLENYPCFYVFPFNGGIGV